MRAAMGVVTGVALLDPELLLLRSKPAGTVWLLL